MKKIADVAVLFRKFSIFELSGTVLSETTHSDVYHYPDTPAFNFPGVYYSVGAPAQSKVTQYQTIYLTDDDGGVERIVELVDFFVPCRPGHRITLWCLDETCWFAAMNHDLGQFFSGLYALQEYTLPQRALLIRWLIVGAAMLGLTTLAVRVVESVVESSGEPPGVYIVFAFLIVLFLLVIVGVLVNACFGLARLIIARRRMGAIDRAMQRAAKVGLKHGPA